MSEKDVKREIKAIKKISEEFAKNPEKACKFLIKAGILNKNGTKLAKRYRPGK